MEKDILNYIELERYFGDNIEKEYPKGIDYLKNNISFRFRKDFKFLTIEKRGFWIVTLMNKEGEVKEEFRCEECRMDKNENNIFEEIKTNFNKFYK